MSSVINYLETLKTWGWHYPSPSFAQTLRLQLEREFLQSDLSMFEKIAYHQDRDDLLLRHQNQPDRFTIIHLEWTHNNEKIVRRPCAVFDGPFSQFVAREQNRHAILRRMTEQPNNAPGICPVCFAVIIDPGFGGGIWTGSIKSKASNGPLHSAICKSCNSQLIAMPTKEEAESGLFFWEFSKWGEFTIPL